MSTELELYLTTENNIVVSLDKISSGDIFYLHSYTNEKITYLQDYFKNKKIKIMFFGFNGKNCVVKVL